MSVLCNLGVKFFSTPTLETTPLPVTVLDDRKQILDMDQKASDCLLWRMQEEYYGSLGIEAWDQTPFYITSNPTIGDAYADMVIAFLKDARSTLDPEAPIYLVELATGTGCFSYYMLTALLRKLAQFESLKNLKVRYVMTDFAPNLVEFWETNESLKPFFDAGVLDCALFRPEEDAGFFLRHADEWVTAETVKNPMVMVANYFFDTIRQDMFRVTNHQLAETRLTYYRDRDRYHEDEPVLFEHLKADAAHYPVDRAYYDNAQFNAVLADYCETMPDASILFPLGALTCIQNLQRLSGNRLVLLSSDKGFTEANYMAGHYVHTIMAHGSFSFMVNYDAIRRYFQLAGGTALLAGDHSHALRTAMCVLMPDAVALEETRYIFNEKIDALNPINNAYSTRYLAEADQPGTSPQRKLRAYVAQINLTHCDPQTTAYLSPLIMEALVAQEQRDFAVEADLRAALAKAETRYYSLHQGGNSLHWIARIYYVLGENAQCIQVAAKSLALTGPKLESYLLMSNAYEGLGNYALALAWLQEYRKLDAPSEKIIADMARLAELLNAETAA